MATVWQPNPVWTQQMVLGVYTGVLPEAPAVLLMLGRPTSANKASRCSSGRTRSPALAARPTKCVGRNAFPTSDDGRRQGRGQEQQDLWQQFFRDPTMWWDNRQHKVSCRSPSKGSGEVQCMLKAARVHDQPVSLDWQKSHGAPPPASTSSWDKSEPGERQRSEMCVVTAATVSTLCQQGKLSQAVGALESLAETDSPISQSLLYTVLKLCAAKRNLVVGRQVHDLTVKLGYESDTYLGNHILRMYAFGGRLQEAMHVFTRVGKPDAFMWSSIISAYAKHGKPYVAIQLYLEMRRSGVKADAHVFVAVLQACAFAADLGSGRNVHRDVLYSGIPPDLFVGTCLVDMYAKCGQLGDARKVFDSMPTKTVVTWNALIAGYAQQGLGHEAFLVYEQMEREGQLLANDFSFACLLKACASTGALQKGRQLHSLIVERGLLGNVVVGNCLVDMYAKCGELEDARRVFESLATKDVVTWNALIAGYAQRGLALEMLLVYGQMEQGGLISANHVTFACLLKACASTGALQWGRWLHSQIVERGLLDDVVLGNSLVDMYAKCGELEGARRVFESLTTKNVVTWNALISGYIRCGELGDAREVFDSMTTKNVVTWNALIAGYAEQGLGREALFLLGQMEEEGVILVNHVTLACLLKACASTGALQKGRQLHSQIVERGLLDNLVLGNCLVDMYSKFGEIEDARQVFDSMAAKDVVTWTALISGYGACDEGHKALACFDDMLAAGIQPDGATFTCVLVACSHEGLVHEGRKHFDSMAEQHGIQQTIEHYTCMIDLLGRAGHLDEAEKMLLSCEARRNVVALTSLLNACKNHGDIERAMWCFESIVTLDPQGAPAYVLMANAYADAGRWLDVDRIENRRRGAGANKKPAVATIEVRREVHQFLVGCRREDIALKVESLNERLKRDGEHVPHTKLVLKPLGEVEKENALCGHAEKLALAFGLLNTPSGTPLVVTKNLRMCSDCHRSTEIMSRIEQRDIVVRDGYRVHRFTAGACSCNGRP